MKKPWQMNHGESVEFFAGIADKYIGDLDAATKIAAEIRSHQRHWKLTKTIVYDCHVAHPEWTARELATHLDCLPEFIYQCADRGGWTVPRLAGEEKAKALGHRFTKQAVLTVHLANPNWTAREIADALGCDHRFVNYCAKRDGWVPRRVRKSEVSFINRRNSSKPRPSRRKVQSA